MRLRTPLSLYVVYHPDSDTSQRYADVIHDWFRLVDDDGDSTEAGIPVWYRCALEGGKLTPEMRVEDADLNAIVVLVSAEMLLDDAWRQAVQAMVRAMKRDGSRDDPRIYPVSLCPGASNLAWLFEGQALPGSSERALRRALTEAVTRELRRAREPDARDLPPAPVQVFLSHAKADGLEVARSLRDDLAKVSQLKTWFDENDLAPGYEWRSPLLEQPEHEGTAVIAVVSDVYPSRNWCVEEATRARTPRPMKGDDIPEATRIFTVSPTVAVILPQRRWSRQLAQLAQVTQIGWVLESPDQPDRVADVVDRLLLETLLIFYYRAFAVSIARHRGDIDERLVLLTWVPDHWTLAWVLDQLRTSPDATLETGPTEAASWTLAYPGRGLRRVEQEEREAEARRRLGGKVRLVPQERLEDGERIDLGELRVALSGGGKNADVARAGLGMRHVNDVMFRLSQRLLEAGAKLEFGGALSNYSDILTKGVIAAAAGWFRLAEDKPQEPGESPLTNYAAWPFHRFISTRQQTELFAVCRFVRIDPDVEGLPKAQDFEAQNPEHARWSADALTKMRVACSRACRVRVVFAGTIRGWRGWIPGILEEVACSIEEGRPVLVIGGFGGMAGEIANFLRDPGSRWPESATLAAALSDEPFQLLCQAGRARELARLRFLWAENIVHRYRDQLHDDAKWPHEVPRPAVLELLGTSSPTEAVRRVLAALGPLAPPGG